MFARACALAARRPALTLAVVAGLAFAGGLSALRLVPSTGIDTFVDGSSPAAIATASQERQFGSDPVVVLVRDPLSAMLAPASLQTLTRLEACLAGQYAAFRPARGAYVPVAHAAYGEAGGPCARLMSSHAAQVVYGPATFVNRAVAAINGQLGSLVAGAGSAIRVAERTALRLSLARGLSRARAEREAA
ncbi:MAG: hypothetical protein ACRDN0_19190, partial [Trebonia sp.]